MRRAGPEALDALEPLLVPLRAVDGLTERGRGVFYRGSKAFLHFHEDPAGLFADVHLEADWERVPVTTARERTALLRRIQRFSRQ